MLKDEMTRFWFFIALMLLSPLLAIIGLAPLGFIFEMVGIIGFYTACGSQQSTELPPALPPEPVQPVYHYEERWCLAGDQYGRRIAFKQIRAWPERY